ncbi:helix-turn-helix domain-containing protein [Streptomyces sp. NPDC056488]|uniref:helix-turn-helix domain-containing protein n=1 Tax=Streptomyces sp. NPDC056488 TaxID=3345836 RepID=UPI003676AE48
MTTTSETPAVGLSTRPAAVTNRGHGSPTWVFTKNCPCKKCRVVKNAYARQVHRRRCYGTWQPYVDAAPTVRHLRKLHDAGISYAQIARQSGLHENHVHRIANGHSKQVRPATAEAILALTAESVQRKVLPITGSARRLQALAAIGWPFTTLATYIGMNPRGISRINYQPYIFQSTAKAIVAAYERLKDQKPEDHGVSLVGAQKSRALAERRGWPDPLWWEDMGHIDDPEFDPATAERELNRDELGALRREEIEHLSSYGCDAETIAKRLHMHLGTVRGVLRELRTGERRDRKGADA